MEGIENVISQLVTGVANGSVSASSAIGIVGYLLMNVAKGSAGFRVPWVSDWLARQPKWTPAVVVLGVSAVTGALAAGITGGWAVAPMLSAAITSMIGAGGTALAANNLISHAMGGYKPGTTVAAPVAVPPAGASAPVTTPPK